MIRTALFSMLLMLISWGKLSAQVNITDSFACNGSIYLQGHLIAGPPTGIPLSLDDGYSGLIPIGFSFNFYGTNYTQCVIGSNGNIGFNPSLANAYDPWPISSAIPNNADLINEIAACYSDIDPAVGGTLYYYTVGTAPNRKFAVTWCTCDMFSCNAQQITMQAILYETTNIIEVHIGHKYVCGGWNGGYAIEGVEGASGTGTFVTGRNYPTQWTVVHDAQQFTPVGNPITSYNVAPITYAPIPVASATINWYVGNTLIGTGPQLIVTPTVTTTYTALVVSCGDTTSSQITIVNPLQNAGGGTPHIDSFKFTNPTACGYCDGVIRLFGLKQGFTDSVFYKKDGVQQTPIVTTTQGPDSEIILNNLCAGTYSNIYVKVGYCVSNVVGPITLSTPPIVANFSYDVTLGCSGDLVTFQNLSSPTPNPPIYQSTFKFGDGATDVSNGATVAHTYTTQGTFPVTLIVSDGYCTDSTEQDVTLIHPLSSSFTVDKDTLCLGQAINFTNQSVGIGPGGTGPSYNWDFGDGITDTAGNPSHIYAQPGTYNVTLNVTDFIPCTATSSQQVRVEYFSVRTDFHDTTVCLATPMQFKTYINSPYDLQNFNFNWTPGTGLDDSTAQQPNYMHFGNDNFVFTATSVPFGCVAKDSLHILSNPPLKLSNVTADQVVNYGQSVQLNADGADYYFWTPDDGTLNNPNINHPVATPLQPTYYVVHGMTQFGCRDSAVVYVNVDFGMTEFIPSAFTPNGDGRNDVFRILNMKYQKLLDFRVYNRWGQQIFQTTDVSKGWDGTFNGTPQDMGVYNYVIIVARPDGTEKTYTGAVSLIR